MCAFPLTALLQVEGVSLSYRRGERKNSALQGVSFALQVGVVNTLLGENGAGKTTLLRILLGQLRPQAGRVSRRGQRPSCRYLPEDGFLAPSLSASHWAPALLVSAAQLTATAEHLGIADLLRRPVRTSSKEARRRCELALILAGNAELYILDEPTVGLYQAHIESLKGLMRTLLRRGSTVLLSTHMLREWQDSVDRVVLLHRGRVRRTEDPSVLLAAYRLWVPTLTPPPALPSEAFALSGSAVAPADASPPAGWSAHPATAADVFLKEIGDDWTHHPGAAC